MGAVITAIKQEVNAALAQKLPFFFHTSNRKTGYQFPNDQREQDRLDARHHVMVRLMHDRLFLAPIDLDGMRILDIGTGTGIWAMQLGR